MKIKLWVVCLWVGSSAFLFHQQAEAQEAFASGPIRMVLGFPPGATTDSVARLLGQKLSAQMNTPVLVENRTGANGNIAAEFVAKSKPSGHTLLFNTMTVVLGAAAGQKTGFDVLKDFAPVSRVASSPNLIVLHPSAPADNLAQFIAWVRGEAGKLSYSSAGTGSPSHIGMELLLLAHNLSAVHVPYKGAGPALTDVVAGHIPFTMAGQSGVIPVLKDRRVKVVGISSLRRSPLLPDVPALAESMLGFEVVVWLGVMAPAGTPQPVIGRLNAEIGKAMQDAEMRKRLATEGADPGTSSPEEYAAYLRGELERWTSVFKKAGIKLDD